MNSLGIQHIYQGHEDKRAAFYDLLDKIDITPEEAAHVGDDLLDLPIMVRVGLAIAVDNANFAVKEHAHWCTSASGGNGAVREVCDFIMKAQGNYDDVLNSYLK